MRNAYALTHAVVKRADTKPAQSTQEFTAALKASRKIAAFGPFSSANSGHGETTFENPMQNETGNANQRQQQLLV